MFTCKIKKYNKYNEFVINSNNNIKYIPRYKNTMYYRFEELTYHDVLRDLELETEFDVIDTAEDVMLHEIDKTYTLIKIKPVHFVFKFDIYKDVLTGKYYINKRFYNYKDIARFKKNIEKSLSRAKLTVKKLCDDNNFTHFLTITFNKEYLNRYDIKQVHNEFRKIIKKIRYVYGNDCKYMAVPEFHRDGAIHYHLLFAFERSPKLKYFGKTKSRNNKYYLQGLKHKESFFIVVEKINSINSALGYISKYLNKNISSPSSRRYSASCNLDRLRLLKVENYYSDCYYHEVVEECLFFASCGHKDYAYFKYDERLIYVKRKFIHEKMKDVIRYYKLN